MQGPGRPDIVNAGSGETRYSWCMRDWQREVNKPRRLWACMQCKCTSGDSG
ncbi:unnamed protein product [Staurois parvus]|uniref:Uncharacterized protein n=1 Tax=Staurois parvus TaxID=386267 RepID=A0ABN9CHI1_9NEOB|nr:unnamed protein product [Staurois parvus]